VGEEGRERGRERDGEIERERERESESERERDREGIRGFHAGSGNYTVPLKGGRVLGCFPVGGNIFLSGLL